MDLSNLETSDDVLLGDSCVPVVPPSLLAPAPVLDFGFHPKLPIFAVGMVTGEVAIYEYNGSDVMQKPLVNDFTSWVFGRNKLYDESKVVVSETNGSMRLHPHGSITSMEFTDDGAYLVSASSDRTVSVLDCVTSCLVIHLTADSMEVAAKKTKNANGLKPQRNGNAPAKTTRKTSSKRYTVTPNPHQYGIASLCVCDENLVATGDDDGLIAVWDMRERRPVHVYHEHGDYVSQLIFFTDVQELVSGSGDTCLGVYDVRAGRIRDFSEPRNDELNCFAFINSSGANRETFTPSIICGTPSGSLPIWKYGSWRRPYDVLDRHPRECESIISFNSETTVVGNNLILTGACDGLVRVVQMYPLRRNLCQLSARDYTYSHANSIASSSNATANSYHNSNYIVRKQRGHEGITRMHVSHDNQMLAVGGDDNIIDFVDIRFLNDEKAIDVLRNKTERRHMSTLREIELDAAAEEERKQRLEEEGEEEEEEEASSESSDAMQNDSSSGSSDSDSSDEDSEPSSEEELAPRKRQKQQNDHDDDQGNPTSGKRGATATKQSKASRTSHPVETAVEDNKVAVDPMEELQLSRQQKRERVAAAKWLKEEKKKKINFTFEKRRRRVGGFFSDMTSYNE
ncbi:unnamed protein product [Phytomonas sp. EM1]|nr:unnamed protein product [Phytomonas sp. EM1]|eukprot:CCW63871.1 unnamed protein product [Phytomonas sp. isolate EM1]